MLALENVLEIGAKTVIITYICEYKFNLMKKGTLELSSAILKLRVRKARGQIFGSFWNLPPWTLKSTLNEPNVNS